MAIKSYSRSNFYGNYKRDFSPNKWSAYAHFSKPAFVKTPMLTYGFYKLVFDKAVAK